MATCNGERQQCWRRDQRVRRGWFNPGMLVVSGTSFPARGEDGWPKPGHVPSEKCTEEATKELTAAPLTFHTARVESRLDPENFSSWIRLLRITAWVLRFVTRTRKRKSSTSKGSSDCAASARKALTTLNTRGKWVEQRKTSETWCWWSIRTEILLLGRFCEHLGSYVAFEEISPIFRISEGKFERGEIVMRDNFHTITFKSSPPTWKHYFFPAILAHKPTVCHDSFQRFSR